jgi:adenosine deaminase CECR1
VDWLLDRALETPGMHMHAEAPLTPENLEMTMFDFQYSVTTASDTTSIFDSSYKPGTLVPVAAAADSFPVSSGSSSRDAFRAWFKTRTTITPEESMKHHEGINVIWAKFQSVFRVIHGIVYYEPIFRRFVHEVLHNVHGDGCLWADIRLAFVMQLRQTDTGAILPRHEVVRIFGEVVDAYVAETSGAFWGSRIIWTTVRAFDAKLIMDSMIECIDAKKRHPHLISGFDLVAQEDKGRTLHSHLPELLQFRRLCADAGVDIPLYLHAGETLGDGTETDNNLFDAVLLGAKRIGHGFSMYKHPHLMELARKHGICLEVCPISNEILRLTASIMQHPLPALLAHGVPVSINNDDPGILGQMRTGSMTHDFWQVLQAYDNVGLEGLGDLAETGVRFAAFDGAPVGVEEGVRKERLEQWRVEWEKFCAWVCEEFKEWD